MTGQLTACDRCPESFRDSQLWKVLSGGVILRLCDACHDGWLLEASRAQSGSSARADPQRYLQGSKPTGGTPAGPRREFEWP